MDLKNKNLGKYLTILALVLFSLTPVLWFLGRPGVLIDGSDTNFPLDPLIWFQRRFFIWNAVSNAGTNFSSSVAGIFFHFIQLVPHLLRLNLQGVEIVSLVFWFSIIVFGSYIFAKYIFPDKWIPRVIFVCLYAFNIYLFNSWENVKVANLALIAFLPVFITILFSYTDRKISAAKTIFYSVICGVVVSGSGINPAYFITLLLGVILAALAKTIVSKSKNDLESIWLGFTLIVISLLLSNSFWIFPTVNYLFLSAKKISNIKDIGFTNWLDSLSQNTSLANVLRLQGAWDWYAMDDSGSPLYIPYAVKFFRSIPFVLFSFMLTGAAVVSLILRRKNSLNLYAMFAVMLVLGVFLGAGGHNPTGAFYRFLALHLPFFSFFRSPWYIFTPLVTLSVAGLVALLFDYLSGKLTSKIILSLAIITVVANLLYNYPLITGKIFRPASKDNFYITFPGYIFDAGKWLTANNEGRIIGYPDDEIERFSWGYNAVETVLNLVVPNETLFSPLSDIDSSLALTIKEFYTSLKKGEVDVAYSLASKLNVKLVLEKNDQVSLAPHLPSRVKNLSLTQFGKWKFYQLPEGIYVPKIYSIQNVFFGYPFAGSEKELGVLLGNYVLLNPNDSVVNTVQALKDSAGTIVASVNSQDKNDRGFLLSPNTLSSRAIDRDLTSVSFEFDIPHDGMYRPALEKYKLADYGLSEDKLTASLDGSAVVWQKESASDSYVYFPKIKLLTGHHRIDIALTQANLASQVPASTLADQYKDAAAIYSIKNFDPLVDYLVRFKYKHIHGDFPSVTVEQRTSTDPVKRSTENLPIFPQTIPFSFYFDPVRTNSNAWVVINAPYIADPLGTRIEYSDVVINKVFSNRMVFVEANNPAVLGQSNVTFTKKSPVEYQGSVTGGDKDHILIFSENYSPDWEINVQRTDGSGIFVKPLHFSANLFANGWYVSGAPEKYNFTIYYKPQNIFYTGAAVSLLSFVLAAGYYLWEKYKN